jgi:hypothetical protein
MDQKQLEQHILQIGWKDNGIYSGKTLCQACLMEKGGISAPEGRMVFERVWNEWVLMLSRDRCAVCGEQKETMTMPAK